MDAPENATLVIGHNAKTREELSDMIRGGRWNDFIREIPVKKGDFIQIDPGTVHAIKGGILILETQQNSDITASTIMTGFRTADRENFMWRRALTSLPYRRSRWKIP